MQNSLSRLKAVFTVDNKAFRQQWPGKDAAALLYPAAPAVFAAAHNSASRGQHPLAPAALVFICMTVQPLFATYKKDQAPPVKMLRRVFISIAGVLLAFGGILNIYGAVKMF